MALRVERKGDPITTAGLEKPLLCHTCKQRKTGIFTTDPYNNPMCHDCAVKAKRAV